MGRFLLVPHYLKRWNKGICFTFVAGLGDIENYALTRAIGHTTPQGPTRIIDVESRQKVRECSSVQDLGGLSAMG